MWNRGEERLRIGTSSPCWVNERMERDVEEAEPYALYNPSLGPSEQRQLQPKAHNRFADDLGDLSSQLIKKR